MPRARRPVCYVTCPSWPASSPAEGPQIAQTLAPLAEELGWEVRISPLLDRAWAGHGAWSPAEERLADLRQALRHDIVWSLRGGYGCMALLPEALVLTARARPAFVGYSDNTILHALWWKKRWEEAFYCRPPPRGEETRHRRAMQPLLRGQGLDLDARDNPGTRILAHGKAEGRIFAACLSVLAGLSGTPLQPDLRGAILCIEDIDEKPYAIDFALRQLWLAGALRGVRALVGGFFTYSEHSHYSGPHVDRVLADWGRRLGVPAIDRLPFGHIDDHLPLPTGRAASLSVGRGAWHLHLAERPRPPWVAT